MLTQEFLEIGAEDADEIEINDGQVSSITFDLTKDKVENQNKSFFGKIKSKFKK